MGKIETGAALYPSAERKVDLLSITGNCFSCGKNLSVDGVDPKQQSTVSVTCFNCDSINTFSVQNITIST